MKNLSGLLFPLCLSLCLCGESSSAADPPFTRHVLDPDFPGGYQVEVADVNGDGKPDVIGVGGGTCAWYENPSWKKRVITTPRQTPGIISSATADLDGDGKAEVAIAYEFSMNEPTRGKLLLATQGRTLDDPWTLAPIADIGSIHRLRWGDVDGDKRPELVVSPIFGPRARPPVFDQDPPTLLVYRTGERPASGHWEVGWRFTTAPVMHAIEVRDHDRDGRAEILTADNGGVTRIVAGGMSRPLIPGAPGEAPKKGSSEVHLGRLSGGRAFLATIDPWHGSQVAVCLEQEPKSLHFGPRTILDDTLADGHALWVADVDRDGDDEIFAGHRGKDHRVSFYDFDGQAWTRTVLDRAVAAQDLRGGDLDGDGTPDVVAIGGATHNVVWYKPIRTNDRK
jgi:hypothetical protein